MCESYAKNMGDLLACRVCFAMDIKLYNMYNHSLNIAMENLTGNCITLPDDCPHYLCSYCTSLLLKSNSFKQRCVRSQEVLKHAAMDVPVLTQELLQNLSLTNSLTHSFSLSPIDISNSIPSQDISIKQENFDIILKEELSDQSDEEPLAEKVKKKKKRDKPYSEFEFEDDSFAPETKEYSEFDNDSFDKPKPLEFSEFEFETDLFGTGDFETSVADSDLNVQDIDVIILSKEQQMEEIVARKESYNYQNSFYKCEHCFKGFITDVTYKNHMIRHDPSSGQHTCEICHTKWPDLRSLKAHSSTSHERKYTCKLCSHTTKSLHRAKEHIKWHQGHSFICKICGASFSKSTSHYTHLRLQHPSKFSCDFCGESFIGQNGLNMHKKKAHRGGEEAKMKNQFICSLCNIQFKNIDALKFHSSLSEDGLCDSSQNPCIHCGDNFSSEELLKEHQKTHQKDNSVRCDECNRTFAHERSFAVHYQRVHLGIKLKYKQQSTRHRAAVVCEICGKKCIKSQLIQRPSSPIPQSLKTKVFNHCVLPDMTYGAKTWTLTVPMVHKLKVAQRALSNATLVYHQRIHTGEKPFQCTECPKRFSVFQRLQIHIRTHTGERPFKCSHCPKAFKHKAALNRHDRVHTGVKPYQCSHCAKSFSQSNSMKLHVKTVHLKMPAPYRNRRNNKINE